LWANVGSDRLSGLAVWSGMHRKSSSGSSRRARPDCWSPASSSRPPPSAAGAELGAQRTRLCPLGAGRGPSLDARDQKSGLARQSVRENGEVKAGKGGNGRGGRRVTVVSVPRARFPSTTQKGLPRKFLQLEIFLPLACTARRCRGVLLKARVCPPVRETGLG